MKKTLLTIACAASSFLAQAQDTTIYRWVDSNNVVHYSHEHPNDRDYARVNVKVSYEPTDDLVEKSTIDELQTKEETEVGKDKAQLDISKQSAEVIKQNCESAKVNLKILSGFEKILYKDPDGESRLLSPEEKKEQLALSEKYAEVYCNSDTVVK